MSSDESLEFGDVRDELCDVKAVESMQKEREIRVKKEWNSLLELAYGKTEGTEKDAADEKEECDHDHEPPVDVAEAEDDTKLEKGEHASVAVETNAERKRGACGKCMKCSGFERREDESTLCSVCGCDIIDHIASAEEQDMMLSDDDDDYNEFDDEDDDS